MRVARSRDPHSVLARRLSRFFEQHGLDPMLADSRSECWASATFAGQRHRFGFRLAVGAPSLDTLRGEIAETDFDLPGHIVADIALVSDETAAGTFAVEALTVEAA